jgi:hypothetical protein
MSNINHITSDRALLPVMLEITGLIGSLIGVFFSLYYVNTKGIDHALDIGCFWIIESISLPFAIAGIFFEDTFLDGKKYSLCTKESSGVFFSFAATMFYLHYGKFCKDSKIALTGCFLLYLFISSIYLIIEMMRKRNFSRYKIIHVGMIFSIIVYVFYFGTRFLI